MYTVSLFFFNDTATTEIYSLSLHDALPICLLRCRPATPRPRPARTAERRRRAAQTGRVRRRAIVLGAPAARRGRGLDHGAPRRALRPFLPAPPPPPPLAR